jgi:hypothetical protein
VPGVTPNGNSTALRILGVLSAATNIVEDGLGVDEAFLLFALLRPPQRDAPLPVDGSLRGQNELVVGQPDPLLVKRGIDAVGD